MEPEHPSHPGSTWQDPEVARRFLEDRRGAIPYGPDQMRMMQELVRHFRPAPHRILDLGCGDGILARTLLSEYVEAQAVLLDHSEPMLAKASEAMAEFRERTGIVPADLAAPVTQWGLPAGLTFDVVVSGYAIHHLPHPRKKALYEEVFVLLDGGGLFVNVEHVGSPSREAEILFEKLYIDHMAERSSKPRAEVAESYYSRPDKQDNILAPVEMQLEWLREIGFEHVDCYFKWLELGVLAGVRPLAGA
jgi:ubiquinone/menaquinone biosynthesis C-methylase UbiE